MATHDRDELRIIRDFEQGRLPDNGFGHDAHLRMAWLFLRRLPLHEALIRYASALRRIAASHGTPEKYHETVTWALLFVLNGRLQGGGAGLDWDAFLARNRDLRDWKALLASYYRAETLTSPTARQTFLLPDRRAEVGA